MGNKYIKWADTNGQWHHIANVSDDLSFLDYTRNDTLLEKALRREAIKMNGQLFGLSGTDCCEGYIIKQPKIKKVIFNDPATIVFWYDGTKTVVKCQPEDVYDKRMGLALCIAKKALGNKGNYNKVFDKWVGEDE